MTAPDFNAFHLSLTEELYSIKNRIRNLVTHWPTDGEFKEAALRSLLRRHLHDSVIVGRGFIVTENASSTQVDILIVDASKPILFREGDLLIVTPDAVKAVVEVKTELRGRGEISRALTKLSQVEKICFDTLGTDTVWTGLFSYNEREQNHEDVLLSLADSFAVTNRVINCVSIGKNGFFRSWKQGTNPDNHIFYDIWSSYSLPGVAPSYFLGNLMDAISLISNHTNSFAWFPLLTGKEPHREWFLPVGQMQPTAW